MFEGGRIAEPDIRFAETDMMHRRTPLPLSGVLRLAGAPLVVRSNSLELQRVVGSFGLDQMTTNGAARCEWLIEVELRSDVDDLAGGDIETFSFGCSRSLRMASGSWFAWTPPEVNGVGFIRVSGSEADRARQLTAYLRAVAERLFDGADMVSKPACLQGAA